MRTRERVRPASIARAGRRQAVPSMRGMSFCGCNAKTEQSLSAPITRMPFRGIAVVQKIIGENAVIDHGKKMPPFRETTAYVSKVLPL